MTDRALASQPVLRRHDAVIASRVHDELILTHGETNVYFSLDGTGREIWELLASPINADALVIQIAGIHDLTPGEVESDVLGFLAELREARLILVEV